MFLKRLVLGIVLGLFVGGLAAFGVVRGLGLETFSPLIAYLSAAATGTLVGLVAGKPIWAGGAKIEAGLKAAFGALLGAGILFAIRRWLPETPLSATHWPLVTGAPGELPAVALPAIGALLGAFYEVDNTPEPKAAEGDRTRIASNKVRVSKGPSAILEDDEEESSPKARTAKKR